MIDGSSNTAFELSQWYGERPTGAGWQLTPVNGIKRKPNGKYAVWVRRLGQGTSFCVTDHAQTFDEAVELRRLAIGNAKPSGVGISRVPLGWIAFVRWRGKTWHLGYFYDEADSAACRCAFDKWAAWQPQAIVTAELEKHCLGPHASSHERLRASVNTND